MPLADDMFKKLGLSKGVHLDEGLIIYQGESYKLVFDVKRGVDYFDGIHSWSWALDMEDYLGDAIKQKRKELWG